MATKFLEFKDGVIVEIGSPADQREEMHTADADRVDTTMTMVASMLDRILRPIGEAFTGFREALDVPIAVKEAEVALGLSFSAEGNLFVTKATTEGTLQIKVTFTPTNGAKEPAPKGGAK